ncbi:YdcK family protein [Kluyvera sp. STS39-E]|uniref:YdcK family protein n=1 Tax=Kluyvera sp. STS39-E TaxID=3234748 RepID=UPI0034C667C5
MNKYRLSEDTRTVQIGEPGAKEKRVVRQIIALRDFADVTAGMRGGWLEDEQALSHDGDCWIYDENSLVYAGARVEGNARVTQPCEISHHAQISGNAWVDASRVSHHARLSGQVALQASQVHGVCHLFGHARIGEHSQIIGAKGFTAERDRELQIYDSARLINCRVVHQAQIYGNAWLKYAFVEHRAEIYDHARLEGNEENNIWVSDCAKVYGNAHIIAGFGEDEIPTLRYSAQVAESAVVEGNCLLKHHVLVGGNAKLRGGPILLDDHVLVQGDVQIIGDVILEYHIDLTDNVVVEAFPGEAIHLRGRKSLSGEQHIIRTPLFGAL